jgi:hypothetical protein
MTKCRGMKFRDADDAYSYFRQREIDEQAEREFVRLHTAPESEAPQGAAGAPQSPAGRNPAAAPDHTDDALAEFAELVLRVSAARLVS